MKHNFKGLNRFLHEKKCYDQFYYNYHHNNGCFSTAWLKHRKLAFDKNAHYNITTLLNYAFDWQHSKEGYDFWDRIFIEARIIYGNLQTII